MGSPRESGELRSARVSLKPRQIDGDRNKVNSSWSPVSLYGNESVNKARKIHKTQQRGQNDNWKINNLQQKKTKNSRIRGAQTYPAGYLMS